MNRTDADIVRSDDPSGDDGPAVVFCRLFSDQVSEHLCLLRKIELAQKRAFPAKDVQWTQLCASV